MVAYSNIDKIVFAVKQVFDRCQEIDCFSDCCSSTHFVKFVIEDYLQVETTFNQITKVLKKLNCVKKRVWVEDQQITVVNLKLKENYKLKDKLYNFVFNHYVFDNDSYIETKELKEAFREYLTKNKMTYDLRKIVKQLKKLGIKHMRKWVGKKQKTVFLGIRKRDEVDSNFNSIALVSTFITNSQKNKKNAKKT